MSDPADREPEKPCLSWLELDRMVLDRRAGIRDDPRQRHATACPTCAARWQQLADDLHQFATEPLPSWVRTTGQAGRLWSWPSMAVASVAAVILGLWLMPAKPTPEALEAGILAKGGDKFGVYIKHRGRVRRGESGEVVAAGDALRFFYASEGGEYFAIINVDGEGQVTAFHPLAATAGVTESGRKVLLPTSTVLDEVPGTETILGVFCRSAFTISDLIAEIERSASGRELDPDCQMHRIRLHKRES